MPFVGHEEDFEKINNFDTFHYGKEGKLKNFETKIEKPIPVAVVETEKKMNILKVLIILVVCILVIIGGMQLGKILFTIINK